MKGRMVHILASGVFLSGFLKDMLCLPRPLSPPLHRITMSDSATLEYGFPSTHSTNAVSVAVYAILTLNSPDSSATPQVKVLLETLSYCYATSIMIGRLYCGMHGFFDVIIGAVLGAFISMIQCMYGEAFDKLIYTGSLEVPLVIALVILVMVRIHPEPADDCPCFDGIYDPYPSPPVVEQVLTREHIDSVAFAGVMIGVELGYWHYARSGLAWDHPVPSTAPFKLEALGWPRTILRIVVGVFVVNSPLGIIG